MQGAILCKSKDVRKHVFLVIFFYFLALLLICNCILLLVYQINDKSEQVQPRLIYFNTFIIKLGTYLCAGNFLDAAFWKSLINLGNLLENVKVENHDTRPIVCSILSGPVDAVLYVISNLNFEMHGRQWKSVLRFWYILGFVQRPFNSDFHHWIIWHDPDLNFIHI